MYISVTVGNLDQRVNPGVAPVWIQVAPHKLYGPPSPGSISSNNGDSNRHPGSSNPTASDAILKINADLEHELIEGDILSSGDTSRSVVKDQELLWPGGDDGKIHIPYELDSIYDAKDKEVWDEALSELHEKTCLRFSERNDESNFLHVTDKSGCFSSIGRRAHGETVVSLSRRGCVIKSIVQHELLHAVGFYHEHVRFDRDNYVAVVWDNIVDGKRYNFEKKHSNDLVGPYDYNSVMHYGATVFSKNGNPTIVPTSPNVDTMGNMEGVTDGDIAKINNLYCRVGETQQAKRMVLPTAMKESVCNVSLHGNEGEVVSPGYPGKYPNGQDCYSHISTKPGTRISLTFHSMNVESRSGSCPYDYVAVYDGTSTESLQLGKFCGWTAPPPVTSTGPALLVYFHSDFSLRGTGFRASHASLYT
uniref:hatching enzyme 1.2-like n=1 Tax=Myxine glutinosa TaxID=7769 RepID=UPI00358E316F